MFSLGIIIVAICIGTRFDTMYGWLFLGCAILVGVVINRLSPNQPSIFEDDDNDDD